VLSGAIAYRSLKRQNAANRSPRNSSEDTMGTAITFKRPDGKDASGYLANAARGNAPGIVVIQEWWGLSDQIKGLCDRFALAGFDALAPDLYKG
jgi:carboxymethylenebutenolidase